VQTTTAAEGVPIPPTVATANMIGNMTQPAIGVAAAAQPRGPADIDIEEWILAKLRSPEDACNRQSAPRQRGFMRHLSLVFVVTVLFSTDTAAQSFSCPIGRNPSCLGYGDKVVSGDAQCFDSFACDYKGFICKSKFDDAVDEYEDLRRKFNDLVQVANSCSSDLTTVSSSLSFEQLRAQGLQEELDGFKRCVQNASNLEDAQLCR
jgi:hypothetical protein